jgi:hypothetical protein
LASAHIIAIVPVNSGWAVECSCGSYARRELGLEVGAWVEAHLGKDGDVLAAISNRDRIGERVVAQVERRRAERRAAEAGFR